MNRVFIIGNPRSGTTLFRLMLGMHPDIVAPPESGFMQWWYSKYKNWSQASINSLEVKAFIYDLQSSKKIETWMIDYKNLENEIVEKKPGTYGELCEMVYIHYGNHHKRDFDTIVDKNNYYVNHINELTEIWPDAKYILIVRDVRDVVCSYRNLKTLRTSSPYKPNLPSDIDIIVGDWVRNNTSVLNFFDALSADRCTVIRYEELIANTEAELLRICQFLGKRYENQMLNYYSENRKEREESDSTIDWNRKTFEKPDSNNIGKYLTSLSDHEISIINCLATELLATFGYKI